MSSSTSHKSYAKTVSFDKDNMWIDLTDGRKLGVPLVYFPRLLNASESERKKFVISGGGIGLHWDDIDEDIRQLKRNLKELTHKEQQEVLSEYIRLAEYHRIKITEYNRYIQAFMEVGVQ